MVDNDWSTKLKKIEREFEGLPPEPSPAFKKMQSEEERRAQERAQQRAAMIGASARLILVFMLFVALAIWPYANECGSGLFGYLGTKAVIVAGGLWVAFTTWRARLRQNARLFTFDRPGRLDSHRSRRAAAHRVCERRPEESAAAVVSGN